jgi:2-desacetyl-2-hydroxyethyl bacteriochlorophyllide A dehydrogenase
MSDTVSRAAVLVAPERLELQDFPVPGVGDDDAILRVEAAGICGSDWAQYQGTLTAMPAVYPIIPGHEIAGTIHAIGEKAAMRWGVRPGDMVVIGMTIPGRGVYGLTESTATVPALWGGYAEYMYLEPNAVVHRVPDGVPPEIAALYVPLSNGVRWAAYVPRLEQGDIVVVLGPGQQGLGCAIAAREAGASMVIVTGTAADAQRLLVAKALGADVTVDVDNADPIDAVAEATGGRMADVVIDVSAESTAPVAQALDMVRAGGQIVLAGLKSDAPVPGFVSDKIVLRGLTIHGSSSPRGNRNNDPDKPIRKALEIMASGRYPLEKMCTHSFSLAEADRAVRLVGRQVPGEDGIHVTICP